MAYLSFIKFLNKQFVLGGAQASERLLSLSSIGFIVILPLQKYIFPKLSLQWMCSWEYSGNNKLWEGAKSVVSTFIHQV